MALIEREAAKAQIVPGYYHSSGVKAMLDSLPSIDAVPVAHGRWERECATDGRTLWYFCSVCGTSLDSHPGMSYCPHCGARMDGGEDDD